MEVFKDFQALNNKLAAKIKENKKFQSEMELLECDLAETLSFI